MSTIRHFVLVVTAIMLTFAFEGAAFAAKGSSNSSFGGGGGGGGFRGPQMMIDFAAHYVRDTKSDGATDTAGRFSIGGMFNDWLGLDAFGLYETRSKDYLVGGDIRISPVDWFFLKVGMGGYSDKETKSLKSTPVGSAGIIARLSRDYYFLTETSYFQVSNRDNVSFGVGLGMYF